LIGTSIQDHEEASKAEQTEDFFQLGMQHRIYSAVLFSKVQHKEFDGEFTFACDLPLFPVPICSDTTGVAHHTATGEAFASSGQRAVLRRKSQMLSVVKTINRTENRRPLLFSHRWAKHMISSKLFGNVITVALIVNSLTLLGRGVKARDPVGVLVVEFIGK